MASTTNNRGQQLSVSTTAKIIFSGLSGRVGGAKTPMAIEAQVIGLISKFRGAAGHWEERVAE